MEMVIYDIISVRQIYIMAQTRKRGSKMRGTRKAAKNTSTKAVVKKAVRKATRSLFAKKVLAVVNRNEETKMVSDNIITPAVAVPAAQTTPLNLARMLPRLGQGISTNQRVGDQINPTFCRTYWTVFPDPAITALYDITLNLVVVKVKGAATDVAVAATPGADFLTVSGGQNQDPNDPNQENMLTLINRYPVNKERYTVLKHFKHRFAKGANSINGPVGAGTNNSPPTAGPANPVKVFSYTWTPPSLMYDNGAAVLPTNHYPCYLIWATANDASAATPVVKFAVRSELYFKDA